MSESEYIQTLTDNPLLTRRPDLIQNASQNTRHFKVEGHPFDEVKPGNEESKVAIGVPVVEQGEIDEDQFYEAPEGPAGYTPKGDLSNQLVGSLQSNYTDGRVESVYFDAYNGLEPECDLE